MNDKYVLVNSKAAPEVFLKVLEVKALLSDGRAKTVSEAIGTVGISRAAYYKYKDYVFDYSESNLEHIFMVLFELTDISGVLSEILKTIAQYGCNILTINQNIPVNRTANVIITARFDVSRGLDELIGALKSIFGVNKVSVLDVQ